MRPKGEERVITCSYESMLPGNELLEISFQESQCIQKGYHLLCFKDRTLTTGEAVTEVCWGDIYNKPA
jgi:hypothetical protein